MVFKNTGCGCQVLRARLGALATDAAGELDVLGHDGHTLGVDGSKVGVLEKTNKVSLGRLLKSEHGGTLEAEVGLEILSDLTDKSLEGKLADEKLGGLLVTTDLTKSHSTRSVSVGLLHTTGSGGALAGSLGGELFTGSFSSGGFSCGLFGTCHFEKFEFMLVKVLNSVRISNIKSDRFRLWIVYYKTGTF